MADILELNVKAKRETAHVTWLHDSCYYDVKTYTTPTLAQKELFKMIEILKADMAAYTAYHKAYKATLD